MEFNYMTMSDSNYIYMVESTQTSTAACLDNLLRRATGMCATVTLCYAVLLDDRQLTSKAQYLVSETLIKEDKTLFVENRERLVELDREVGYLEKLFLPRTSEDEEEKNDWIGLSDIFEDISNSWVGLFATFHDKPSFNCLKFVPSIPTSRPPLHHQHPDAAIIRNAATADIIKFARLRGKTLYDVDCSGRTLSEGAKGRHTYHSLRDFSSKARRDPIPRNALISFVDSDYYHEDLSKYANHDMVLFTFTPKYLTGHYGESIYSIIDENTICLDVPGGPKNGYRHALWNYDSDFVSFQKRGYTYVHRTEYIQYSEEHRMVFLTLVCTIFNPFNVTFRLGRVNLGDDGKVARTQVEPLPNGGYYRFVTHKHQGKGKQSNVYFQATDPLNLSSIHVPVMMLATIAAKAKMEDGLTPGDVQAITEHKLSVPEASLLYTIFSEGSPIMRKAIQRYTLYSEEKTENVGGEIGKDTSIDEVTNKGQAHCNQLTDASQGIPNDNKRNEETSRQKRIEAVRNEVNPRDHLPDYDSWKLEFTNALIGKQRGKPLTRAEVLVRQDRPLQKARNARLGTTIGEKPKVKTFLKSEPVDVEKPARIITQYNTEHCIELSRYTYAFKDRLLTVLNRVPWYAPGLKPRDMHQKIEKIMTKVSKDIKLLGIDYSKYDGSQTEYLRELEEDIYRAYFGDDEHLMALLNEEKEIRYKASCANSKHDQRMKFSIFFERGSGSPLTTDGNTIIAAFIAYCYHRKCGRSPKTAWDFIGMKGGDDGIDLGKYSDFEKVATGAFGMKVTGGQFEKGWVPFYSRLFVKIEGGVSSFCDPYRALVKWHIGMNKMTHAPQSYMNKALGYEVTDKHTIIIKELIKLGKETWPLLVRDLETHSEYTVNKYIEGGMWRPPAVSELLQYSILSEYLSIKPDHLSSAVNKLRTYKSVHEIRLVLVVGKDYLAKPVNVKLGNGFVTLSDKARKTLAPGGGGRVRNLINNKNERKTNKPQSAGGENSQPRATN